MRCLEPEWQARLPSTNTWLLDRLRAGADLPSGYVVAAREQTAGRGRRQRGWISVPGLDLTFSVLLHTAAEPRAVLSAPMAAALGVVVGLARACRVDALPKWPNDVLVGHRKICGILAERRGTAVVIGIGLNVNMPATLAGRIDRPATSVLMEAGREHSLEVMLSHILDGLTEWLTPWEAGGFAALRAAWMQRCAHMNRQVEVGDGSRRIRGRLVGFGEWGQARLVQADGTVREAWAGDLHGPARLEQRVAAPPGGRTSSR